MANLKQAFEYASQNPTSDFAKNLEKLATSGALDGEAKKYGIDLTPFKPVPKEPTIGSKLVETGKETLGGVKETLGRVATGETTKESGALQAVGQVAGGALQATGDVLTSSPVVKDVVSAVAKPVTQGVQAFQGWLENNPTFQKVVTTDVADKIASVLDANPDLARNAEAINNIANAILVAKGSVQTAGKVVDTAKTVTQKTLSKVDDIKNVVPKNLGQKAVDLVSADPEAKVATILQRSTPEDVSFYTNLGQKASVSGEAITPFEYVGNKLAETTKTLEGKLKEIGKAKSDIVAPMREGLSSFSKETKPLIEKLTSLKNSFSEIDASSKSVVQSIINDAKTVSTKLDADRFIDKVQDALYTGNRNMTIVQGSAVDKQLRGIIGEYNASLKKALPKEYGELNTRYSEMIDTLSAINRSLGEVVEGTPIRGAGLIKQYFSPSGSKAKEIFEFVKRETDGTVDLAKEATLAKFAMELFDDPRARSLLQGIGDVPTTLTGVVTKVAEKLGGDKLREGMRESTIRKAKKITKPK